MSARDRAKDFLESSSNSPEWAQAYGLMGIGWALLDLADAIREVREPTYSQVEFTTDDDAELPTEVGRDPLNF